MKLILSLLVTVSIILFGSIGVAAINSTITQVTNDPYENSLPQIKGDYLVWQAYVDGDQEIFLYNIATGVTTQITDNAYADVSVQTDDDYIVWQGFNDGEWDIFLWDGSDIKTISNRGAEDLSPQIADGFIVWTSEPFGDDFVGPEEIILYDVGSETYTTLSEFVDSGNNFDDSAPKINDEVVIWVQTDDQDNTTLYMYDLGDGTITENPDYVWRDSPQRDGDLTVLTRHDGDDREIFLYDSDSREYHQITDNDLADRYPSISGNHIAWMADGEIYLAAFRFPAGEGTEIIDDTYINPGDNEVLPTMPPPISSWEGIGYDNWYPHGYGGSILTWWTSNEKRQLGSFWSVALNEIFENSKFVDTDKDNYYIATYSPAIGAREGGVDMDTYGGVDGINDNDFSSAYLYSLIDGGTSTDNVATGGKGTSKLKLFALLIVLSIAMSFVGYSKRTPS